MTSAIETKIRDLVGKGVMGVASISRFLRQGKANNPYLEGIHEPMSEEVTLDNLTVKGEIPAQLDGLYVRNGPNPHAVESPATHHWFVGDAMLHGVRIQAGEALWYRNRWLRSTDICKHLGEPVASGPRSPSGVEVANTNVIGHAGKIWAIVEAGGFPVEVSETLETRAFTDLDGTLGNCFSAHPHLDPATGELHAVCYFAPDSSVVWHVVVDADGRVRRREPIPVEHGPSIHDCMITESYVIVMDLPVTFSIRALLFGHSFPFRWNSNHEARIGLMPREGNAADIIWNTIDPVYIFHVANAYESSDGKVHLDACVHDDMFNRGGYGPDSSSSAFERLTLDPKGTAVSRHCLSDLPQDFPRINERYMGKNYRYAYSIALAKEPVPEFYGESRLFKHDLESGERQTHDFGPGKLPGEFVFVENELQRSEDDGWLIGFVIDKTKQTSELVILDATILTAEPAARILLPHRIPPGFHGNFIATS